jgi:hypothetical protein
MLFLWQMSQPFKIPSIAGLNIWILNSVCLT